MMKNEAYKKVCNIFIYIYDSTGFDNSSCNAQTGYA